MKNFNTDISIFIREIDSGIGEWVDLPFYSEDVETIGIREGKEWEIVDFDNYTGIDIPEIINGYYPSLTACNDFKDLIDRAERQGSLNNLGILINRYGIEEGQRIWESENYCIRIFTPDDTNELKQIIMEDYIPIPEKFQSLIDYDKLIRQMQMLRNVINMKEGYILTQY